MTFLNSNKACNTRPWRILESYGCPEKLISILQNFYDNMQVTVRTNDKFSAPLSVTIGVKQRCVLASALFVIFLSAMFEQFKDRCLHGINVTYRIDRVIFNIGGFDAQTKHLALWSSSSSMRMIP